jgi:phage virion morphogenesis protein
MTGVSITATLTDEEALARLGELVARMERPEGFYRNVGEHMVDVSVAGAFDQERAPDGAPWAPLAPSTVRKRKAAGPILRLRGHLRGSISYRVEAEGVRIGTPSPYAAIHQLGGRIEREPRQGVVRFARNAKSGRRFVSRRHKGHVEQTVQVGAYVIEIPARPFLGVSAADEARILRLAEIWLVAHD